MQIGIIGAGKWGEALAFALSQNPNNKVKITSRHPRELPNFVPLEKVLLMEYLVIAISAQHVREWMQTHFRFNNQKILVASKGIEVQTGAFLNEIFGAFLPQENLAYISGPSFAAEVIKGLPTALVISSTNQHLSKRYAQAFPNFIKAYTSEDVVGAEVGGAYKNVIAIAGGICDGLALGNNARAALISRGLVEMSRFGAHFGADQETFLSLGGAGDLFLSASSKLSRNYRVGFGLAEGKSLETILQDLGEVAEGVHTAKAIVKIANKEQIYTPIATQVYEILEGKDPRESLRELLE